MEIRKSYEFISAGGKIIVRRIDVSDSEFRTILVADALIEKKRVSVQNAEVFVFKSGKGWYLCIDADSHLLVSPLCSEYRLEDNCVLYYTDKWYCYHSEKGFVALGEPVCALPFLWLDKTEDSCRLNWFVNGVLQQKSFLDCQKLPGYGIKKLPLDFLKVTTEDGDFFVSARRRTVPNYARPRSMGKKTVRPVSVETEILFRTESFADKVAFYKFARWLCQDLLTDGLSRVVSMYNDALCDYVYYEGKDDYVVEYTAGLRNPIDNDVTIYVNLSKLFKKEKGAYDVRCPELSYQRTADEIEFAHRENEQILWVYYGRDTDALSAKTAPFGQGKLCYEEYTYEF